uniref:response regulator n=1 Tax=uncultured Rhizobium sp. TaxID=155567 RepID=UPI0026317AA7|nr:response regulator [uncultured Rhizobium sp.]
MKEARILVVDDEPQIIRFLRPALDAAGYDMLEAGTGADALRKAATLAPDVMILDLGLPDMDGKDVISRVRSFSDLPILILSARDRESEKIEALDLGADDYIEKPFRIGELLARVRTALRHHGKADRPVARISTQGLVIDFEHRTVERHGKSIKLTPKEYDLLAILARNAGKVLTHRTLLTAVWGPAHVEDTQYLRVFIGQLRSKVEDIAEKPVHISTEPGVGYRFNDSES